MSETNFPVPTFAHSGPYRPFPPPGLDWTFMWYRLIFRKEDKIFDPLLTAVTSVASLLVLVVTVVHVFGQHTLIDCKLVVSEYHWIVLNAPSFLFLW